MSRTMVPGESIARLLIASAHLKIYAERDRFKFLERSASKQGEKPEPPPEGRGEEPDCLAPADFAEGLITEAEFRERFISAETVLASGKAEASASLRSVLGMPGEGEPSGYFCRNCGARRWDNPRGECIGGMGCVWTDKKNAPPAPEPASLPGARTRESLQQTPETGVDFGLMPMPTEEHSDIVVPAGTPLWCTDAATGERRLVQLATDTRISMFKVRT
jgi:hypothetical protein